MLFFYESREFYIIISVKPYKMFGIGFVGQFWAVFIFHYVAAVIGDYIARDVRK